ncbi:hypothetical protein OHA40_34120 [Nocardia sp. NBC_00508]|uniref:hypothetical protein n=1 Tax=Nocardia sp. NBC_00508 TaxID=2975992 RepID=UPI002E806204|nr:hypothetical protein [Nocardia sp. NBC_00508]WUD66523.1 hypothetical protein OHA40_34120 [Nocardia sp. NBC_00508]
MNLRLLGSGSDHGACPAVYATDTGVLVVQGDATDRTGTVLVPHQLLDWLEPGMRLPVEATGTCGSVLVAGEPVTDPALLAQLTLACHETAVVVR